MTSTGAEGTSVAEGPQHTHGHAATAHGGGHHGALRPSAGCGSLAIDVGGGYGALVIYPSARYRDLEIEISRIGGGGQRVHTGVHERTTRRGSLLTAVFGSLPAGEYMVWASETTAGPIVAVPDGGVAEVRLS
ncbi:MAG TPA: hypothetical protein VME22_22435 [Solirubrobacteraceae bacterium]|nr:hypothetical protein [Solirubrobacteraceae bacterium]